MWSSFTTILWCLSMPKLCTLMKLFWGRIISVELIITSKEDKAQIHLNYLYRVIQNKNWRRKWQPIPVFLTREFHGQKEEPGGLPSMGSGRVRHDWATSLSLFIFMHWRRKWQPTPVFFPGESQGQRSPVGCCLWGLTESDITEGT